MEDVGSDEVVGDAVVGLMLGNKVGDSVGLKVGSSVTLCFTMKDRVAEPLSATSIPSSGAPVASALKLTATLLPNRAS